jgi:hypothetical protein
MLHPAPRQEGGEYGEDGSGKGGLPQINPQPLPRVFPSGARGFVGTCLPVFGQRLACGE